MKTKVAARIERLREKMTRQKIDTFLVLIQENRRYLERLHRRRHPVRRIRRRADYFSKITGTGNGFPI